MLEWRIGKEGHGAHVRQIQHDDPHRWRFFAHHPQERREILPEGLYLTVDESRLIGCAGAAAECRRDRVDVVRARENRYESCSFGNEWRLLLEDVGIGGSAPLRTEILDAPADDCAWPSQVRLVDSKAARAELACRHLHVPASVRTIGERNTEHARAKADRIARPD